MEKLITIVFFCALPALCLLPETDVCYRLVTDFSQDSCTEKTKNSKDKSYYYSRGSNCLPKCEEYVQMLHVPVIKIAKDLAVGAYRHV
nr:unnamed protein product [Callosobruchus chinensis]